MNNSSIQLYPSIDRWGNFLLHAIVSSNNKKKHHLIINYWERRSKTLSCVLQIILDINQFNQHSQKLVKQENVLPLGFRPIQTRYSFLLLWRKKKKKKQNEEDKVCEDTHKRICASYNSFLLLQTFYCMALYRRYINDSKQTH